MRPAHSFTSSTCTESGFSLVEMLVVVAVMAVVAASAVPMTGSAMAAYRLKGDAQGVRNVIALAKMRAASRFTRARVHFDLGGNTYHLEWLDRSTSPATWTTEGADHRLSTGVTFGFGVLSEPPPNTQDTIGFSSECLDGSGASIADTACVTFNSRGVPVDGSGSPVGNNGIYVTDGTGVYATTITMTPLVRFWWTKSSSASWVQQ